MVVVDSVLQRHQAEASDSQDALMQIENITVAFKGLKAVDNISFDVKKGEICALVGPNGAGKSSMLNLINGVYVAQKGSIVYEGKRYTKMNPHQAAVLGIARTFQNIALFQGMTVLDNIFTGRNLKMKATAFEQIFYFGRPRQEEVRNRYAVEKLIEFLQIQSIRNTTVNKLPYGLQKRVELGRAMAMEPNLLLLDEPMAGMNLEEKMDMSCFIMEINREFGTTIILIEHDMGVVMDISNHVVVMDYGKKIGDGNPMEVKNDPKVIEAYLGTTH